MPKVTSPKLASIAARQMHSPDEEVRRLAASALSQAEPNIPSEPPPAPVVAP